MKTSPYESNRRVYNKLGKKYLDGIKNTISTRRLLFSKLFKSGDRILDVGCAGGRDSKFFIKKGLNVTGIDFSTVLLNFARKEVPQATFKKMNLLNLNFKKETFNGIWANAVLHHLKRKDVPKVLGRLYKVLKQNGTLHLTVKKGAGEEYAKENLSYGEKRFFTYFSKAEMEKLLKAQGFKITFSKVIPDEHKRVGLFSVAIWAQK